MTSFIIFFQIILVVMFVVTLALLSATKSFNKSVLIASKVLCVITILMTTVYIYYFFGNSSIKISALPTWLKIEYAATVIVGLIFYIPVIIDVITFIRVKTKLKFVIEDVEQLNPKLGSYTLKYRSDRDIKAMVYSFSTSLFKSPNLTPIQQEILHRKGLGGEGNIYHIILGLMFENTYSLLEYDFDLWCYCARRYYQDGNSEVNRIIVRHDVGPYFSEYQVFKYIYLNGLVSVDNVAIEIAEKKLKTDCSNI